MKKILTTTMLGLLVSFATALNAQTNKTSTHGEPDAANTDIDADTNADDAKQLDKLLTQLALESMPVQHVEDKDWGQQSERWDGVKISFHNGKLHTKRRKKKVNHGTWERYAISLVDPEDRFSIQLDHFQELAKDRVSFEVGISADVDVSARQAKWVKGVQLYSISANGSASVNLRLSIELGSSMDVSQFPPDLILEPQVTQADIELSNFRIDRVSKAGGEFTQQLTRIVRKKLDQEIARKEKKLVKKLNTQLEKNKDRFTLSVHDALKSKWASAADKLLNKEVED